MSAIFELDQFQSPLSGAVVRGDTEFMAHYRDHVSVPSERGSGARQDDCCKADFLLWFQSPLSGAVVRGRPSKRSSRIGVVSVPSERGSGARLILPLGSPAFMLFQSPLSGAVVRGIITRI